MLLSEVEISLSGLTAKDSVKDEKELKGKEIYRNVSLWRDDGRYKGN